MDSSPLAPLAVDWRGRERYALTWAHQLELHAKRRDGAIPDTLVLVEHEPVITLGRQGELANLLLSEERLTQLGIDFHRVERGGDITYHGPGQLVGYPIWNLRERGISVRDLMRGLEEALIRVLARYGIQAGRIEGLTGVWVDGEKAAALGVAVKSGISYHGFAFNVEPNLEHFKLIVPCGITDKPVTSMARLLGRSVELDEVRAHAERELRAVFGFAG
ncbi:MAG: lipoyl(octanoyl) transferase LipB [Anaerolineae bacterium]|nr:lipoyl(octanoyl) transferase LipB [Anaerolineae bacterium]